MDKVKVTFTVPNCEEQIIIDFDIEEASAHYNVSVPEQPVDALNPAYMMANMFLQALNGEPDAVPAEDAPTPVEE